MSIDSSKLENIPDWALVLSDFDKIASIANVFIDKPDTAFTEEEITSEYGNKSVKVLLHFQKEGLIERRGEYYMATEQIHNIEDDIPEYREILL